MTQYEIDALGEKLFMIMGAVVSVIMITVVVLVLTGHITPPRDDDSAGRTCVSPSGRVRVVAHHDEGSHVAMGLDGKIHIVARCS